MIPGARLVLLGRQGAGKGTQCVRLSRHYLVPHVSTGDILRAAVKEGTAFGRKAAEYMDAGELLPDDIITGVVDERLERDDTRARGFILDGFPRTVVQAKSLEEITLPVGIDLTVNLEVATDVVLQRLAGRRVCVDCGTNFSTTTPPADDTFDVCGGRVVQRADDTEASIRRRLEIYEQQTTPLIAWYRDRDQLVTVDGLGSTDEVTDRLIHAIDRHKAAHRR
ncbi:adenylate kinase [soil metagenome]